MKVLFGVFDNQYLDSGEVTKFLYLQVPTQTTGGLHFEAKRLHTCVLKVFNALIKLRNLSDEGYERFNML